MAGLHPLGRVGRAGEVEDTVAYLLSDATSFVTRTVIPVAGGAQPAVRTRQRVTRSTLTLCRIRGYGRA